MAKQLTLARWIVLATAGGAAFYGSSRLAATDSADDVVAPVARAEAARVEPATSGAARAESAEPARVAVADTGAAGRAAVPAGVASARAPIEVNRTADAFPSMVWTPPPPPPAPPPPPPPPPPPTAPSLPFKFVGMIEQKSDRPAAFLAKGDALHIVRVGDVVDSTYRVDSLSPTQIVVTYLPLNQRQSLSVDGGQK